MHHGIEIKVFSVKTNVSPYQAVHYLSFLCSPTDDLGKPGSDAGMPAIEDNELGKPEDVQFGKQCRIICKVSQALKTRRQKTTSNYNY